MKMTEDIKEYLKHLKGLRFTKRDTKKTESVTDLSMFCVYVNTYYVRKYIYVYVYVFDVCNIDVLNAASVVNIYLFFFNKVRIEAETQ